MGKLQSIENALASINEAKFQTLCDSILAIRNKNYRAFSRTGSQKGKEKTVKGTPDSFLLLPDGKYLFVEYSTNITSGAAKVEDDISKCLDEKKTGVPKEQISEIIICLNFSLNTKQIEGLKKPLADTNIALTVETLDSLALEIHLHHRNLAHEFLSLPLDSGQVVSISQFIEEYNRKGAAIATPLDNQFIERETEQKQLSESLANSDFIIVTGPPGVGKTKLCLEAIQVFLADHLAFEAYCISYKSHTLLEDLYQYLDPENDYVLFVDDANRIDAFNQITGFYSGVRKGRLKVVITVRDYAYSEVGSLAHEFGPVRIDINRMTDEQIVKVIESEPFEIKNPEYQDPIKHIADGNPRLAIMASLLAKKKQNINALRDVSDLFEKYYATFIHDQSEFASDLNIRCLGLISFFYTIPYQDREVTEPILQHFDITYNDFIDAIDKLDSLELVEIQFEHVKIPEQNLSTYFFFKAFVQDELLSFETLLINYFQKFQSRFKDSVIPANNTFGYERVMKKLQPYLRSYWKSIELNWEDAQKFLSTFWFYVQDETLVYLLNHINNLSEVEVEEYSVHYETNDFSTDQNEILDLLGNFLRFPTTVKNGLEVLFEFIRKRPQHLPEFIHKVRELLLFDRDDRREGFARQFDLFDLIIKGLKGKDPLLTRVFFELAKTFIGFTFQHTHGGRNLSIVFYRFPLPNEERIHAFRELIWTTLSEHFMDHHKWAFETLESYNKSRIDAMADIMKTDAPFVLDIIQTHLKREDFEHCRYVHSQIQWYKRKEIENDLFDSIRKTFTNPLFELYLIVDWDSHRDKEILDFDNHRDYEKIKEKQIRDSIKLTSQDEVSKFFNDFVFLKSKNGRSSWNYNKVLTIIIDETIKTNEKLGYAILELIIQSDNKIDIVPRLVFGVLLSKEAHVERLWKLIEESEFTSRSEWKMNYFLNLDDKLIKEEHADQILQAIEETSESAMIALEHLDRYLKIDSLLFQKIIHIIYDKNENRGARITVWDDLFEKHLPKLGDDLELVKKFYIQQRVIQNHFDFDFKGLKSILKEAPFFLVEYISGLYIKDKHEFLEDHEGMGFVWEFDEAEKIVTQVFDLFREKAWWFGIQEHYCGSFFTNVAAEHQDRSDRFLMNMIQSNYSEPKKVNEVIDIVRHKRTELLEQAILTYLELNQNPEDFRKISWTGSGGVYHGDVIIGDIRAAGWRNILSIVEKSDLGVKILPIKQEINQTIEHELESGDQERKRKFLQRY